MRALPFTVLLLLISATAPLSVSGQETAVQPDQSSYSITTQTSDAYVSDDPSVVYDGLPKQGGDDLTLRSNPCAQGDTDPTPGAEIDIEFSLVTDAEASMAFRIVYEIQFVVLGEDTTDAYVRVYVWDHVQATWEQLDERVLSYDANEGWETNRSLSSNYMSGSGTVKVRLHTGHDVQNCDAYAEARAYEFVIQLEDNSQSNGTTGTDEGGPVTSDSEPTLLDFVACFVFVFSFGALWYILTGIVNISPEFRKRFQKSMLEDVLGDPVELLPLTVSDRGVSTPTEAFAGRIKKGRDLFYIGIVKEGSSSDIDHLADALANQYGELYNRRVPRSEGSLISIKPIFPRKKILVYRDPAKYEALPPNRVTDSEAPGSSVVLTATRGISHHRFLFGRVDGKLLFNVHQGNIEEVGNICEELIESIVNFSRSGGAGNKERSIAETYHYGTTLPPTPNLDILPTRLSWLKLVDTDSRNAEWLELKGRKTSRIPDIILNERYTKLASLYKEFEEEELKRVNRIYAVSMHGDCRVSNWIWRKEGMKTVYSAIDFGNYNARFLDNKKQSRGINRRSSVSPKGKEIEWIRPYLFGHWKSVDDPKGEKIDQSPDAYPDPLFDLAELLASMLLDIWVDPDPAVVKGMEEMDPPIERIKGEDILCNFWEDPQSYTPSPPVSGPSTPHAYSQIIKTSMGRIEDWLDKLEVSKVPRAKRDKESTKKWLRYAIADRLIYKACLISKHEERHETTADVVVKMALYFVNNEYSSLFSSPPPSSPPPSDEDEDDDQGPEPTETGSPNTVTWPGDIHGDPTITITQINKSTVVTGYPDSSAEGSSSGGQNANPSEPSSPNELAEHTETHFLANTDNTGGFAVGDQVYVVDTDGKPLLENDIVWFGEILFIRDNEGILEALLSVLEQPDEEKSYPVDRLRRRNDYLD